MRKILISTVAFITLAACLCCLYSCSDSDVEVPAGMQLCRDDVVDYYLFVPDGWSISMTTGAVGAYCSASDMTNVTVMSWTTGGETTIDEWWEMYESDFNLVFDEMNMISTDNATLNEVAAKKYTYTAKLADTEYYYAQYACMRRGMVYILTFTSTPELYEEHTEDLDNIVANFRFR